MTSFNDQAASEEYFGCTSPSVARALAEDNFRKGYRMTLDPFASFDALDEQVGGNHYKNFEIQPVEFIEKNNLTFLEGCIVKRACRHRHKNGAEDVRKLIHEARLILKLVYGEDE